MKMWTVSRILFDKQLIWNNQRTLWYFCRFWYYFSGSL